MPFLITLHYLINRRLQTRMVVELVKLIILFSSCISFASTLKNSLETKHAEDEDQVSNRLEISIITRDESKSKSLEDVSNNLIENGIESNGKICYKKVMLQEYTDYTEVMTCNHKTQKRFQLKNPGKKLTFSGVC